MEQVLIGVIGLGLGYHRVAACAQAREVGRLVICDTDPLAFPADKTTAALYRFEGGTIGQVIVTYEAHRPPGSPSDAEFCLVATPGMVVGSRVALDSRDTWEDLPRDEHQIVTGTFGCVRSFLGSVLHDTPVPIDGREAFASLAACVAADESAATGRPVVPADARF